MSDKLQKSPLAVVFNIVLAVALVLFIISAAVVFTLNFRPLYYFDVDHLNITAMSGLPREEILQNYNVLIDYNSIFGTKVLNFPTLAMSESGRIHFEEVKNVFGVFEITLIVSGILSLAGIIYRHFKKNPGYLLLSGILTVAITGLSEYSYGTLTGTVTAIDSDVTASSNASYYKMTIKPDATYVVSRSGDKVDLSNGMSVTARVEYDQVTYFEYAMEALGVLFR